MKTDLTKICETKVRVIQEPFSSDHLAYCKNVCSGFGDNCPYERYKAVGNSVSLRRGRVAYVLRSLQ